MMSASLPEKTKPKVVQDPELITKNQSTGWNLPQMEENLNEKVRMWQEVAKNIGPVYPVHGIADGKCTCRKAKCRNPGKHPWTDHGFLDASTDPSQIAEWIREKPHCNIGIAAGGELCVLDVDGPGGEEALRKFEGQFGPLPQTWEVRTGREGGRHLYFTKSPQFSLKSRSIVPGFDIKAEGGGVVGPGSKHVSGREYRVANPDMEMEDLPEAWVEFLSGPLPKESKVASSFQDNRIKKGQRNDHLSPEPYKLFRLGYSREVVLAALKAINATECNPPYLEERIISMVDSAARSVGSSIVAVTPPETFTALEIMSMELPPEQWLVEDVVPTGVGLLGGRPKAGKSWLALNLSCCVALGQPLLNRFPVVNSAVVYLALEDNYRRIQNRLQLMGISASDPSLEKIHFSILWPKFDDDEMGLEYLQGKIDQVEECRLVVIDLLENVRPGKKGSKSDYELAYRDLNAIKRLTKDRDITILVLHHTNKNPSENPLDTILGSTGLTGGTDFTMIVERDGDGSSPNGTLTVRGRDLREDVKARLTLADGWWKWLGSVDQVRRNENDNKVLTVLTREPKSFTDTMKESKIKIGSTFSDALSRLVKDGLAIKGKDGKYRLAPEPGEEGEQDELPF